MALYKAYTTNQCSDRTQTVQVSAQAERISRQIYDDVLADSGYASYDNYEEFEKQNKNIFIPDQQMEYGSRKITKPLPQKTILFTTKKKTALPVLKIKYCLFPVLTFIKD